MTEQQLWDEATVGMSKRGRYKMANYMAHGYELLGDVERTMTLLEKDGRFMAIDKAGNLYVLQPAI